MKKIALIVMCMALMLLPFASALSTKAIDRETVIKDKLSVEEIQDRLSQIDQSDAETSLDSNTWGRFILYTHEGLNIMWGTLGNNYFRGTDNHGKFTWGVYWRGNFAGFYDGNFFHGVYRGNKWKADGLFNQETNGKFDLFAANPPVWECKDSDNGKNYRVAGVTKACTIDRNGNERCVEKEDMCRGDTLLIESYCAADGKAKTTRFKCPYGCADSACLPPSDVCTDEYEPVCARPQIVCVTQPCIAEPQTYSNKCEMYQANAKYLYHGECRDRTITPTNIAPVNAVDSIGISSTE